MGTGLSVHKRMTATLLIPCRHQHQRTDKKQGISAVGIHMSDHHRKGTSTVENWYSILL
jgi:hypothetical protein